jgi:phosphoribosylglycinamide formyltransferase-1
MAKLKIGAIASGSGSNLEAIIKSCEDGILKTKACVEVLICNKSGAFCMERAKNHNIPYELIESDKFLHLPREEYDEMMIKIFNKYNCDLIVLVGYMRLVSKKFINAFNGNVMNIHPALLPAFKGLHAHRDVIEYGAKVSGCTVHFVDAESDHGPIIIQKCVPVYDTDTKATLGPRVLEWEHKIFPKAIELFCDKKLSVAGRLVIIDGDVSL